MCDKDLRDWKREQSILEAWWDDATFKVECSPVREMSISKDFQTGTCRTANTVSMKRTSYNWYFHGKDLPWYRTIDLRSITRWWEDATFEVQCSTVREMRISKDFQTATCRNEITVRMKRTSYTYLFAPNVWQGSFVNDKRTNYLQDDATFKVQCYTVREMRTTKDFQTNTCSNAISIRMTKTSCTYLVAPHVKQRPLIILEALQDDEMMQHLKINAAWTLAGVEPQLGQNGGSFV